MENLMFKQEELFSMLVKDEYTKGGIMDALGLNKKEVDKLCMSVKKNNHNKYARLDIVIAAMGGVLHAD